MTFFEKELRKIVGTQCPEAIYVGRVSYVRLSEMNRAKIHFTTCGTANQYEALQISILNRNDGKIDSLCLRFADVWGKGQNSNINIQQIGPYAWTYNGNTEWYSYHPTDRDFEKLTDAVMGYLDVFQEFEQEWEQQM